MELVKSNTGWIKLYRQSTNHFLYKAEPFTSWQAWTDLLLLANHTDNSYKLRGVIVPVKRGQVGYASETLAERWQWSRGKVLRFLKMLVKCEMIVQQKTSVITLITILNYEEFQGNDTTDDTTVGQLPVQLPDTNKNEENEKNEENVIPAQIPDKPKKETRNIAWLKKNKEQVVAELTAKFPDKDIEYAYTYFLEQQEIKDYGYKNHFQALSKWIRDDRYNKFAKKKVNVVTGTYKPSPNNTW
jgi:hypothetical protein